MTVLVHRFFSPALALALVLVVSACSAGAAPTQTPWDGGHDCPTSQPAPLPAGETRTVTMETGKGQIVMKVESDLSPIAVANFVALATCGFYDGTVFHRIVPGFVIQGGARKGAPSYTLQDEPVTATYHRATVAMAKTGAPNSATSQFFIVLDDASAASLPQTGTYQILGAVTSGMETVDAIAGAADKENPSHPVIIDTAAVTNP